MSKIIEKIKGFGHSLTNMFKENQDDDVSYLDPDTEEGRKLASEMKPFVDRMNALEAKRTKEQRQRENMTKGLEKDDVTQLQKSFEVQNTRSIIVKGKQDADKERTIHQNRDGREV